MTAPTQKLLQIDKLVLHFKTSHGVVQAVDSVDFELETNRAVVILGESGCGNPPSPRRCCDCYRAMWTNTGAVSICMGKM